MALRQDESVRSVPRIQKKKPEWDSTVSDLSVYRLSKNEVERRKRIHQSYNVAAARQELMEKQLKQKIPCTPSPSHQKGPVRILNPTPCTTTPRAQHRAAILREVFHKGTELQHVLARSDHMLSQVKDMFGDDPRRYTGIPTLTAAPTTLLSKERAALQDMHVPPSVLYSPAGIRDESLMSISRPALNDLEDKENVNTDDVYSQAIWQQEHTVVTAGKRQVCEFRRDEKETIASCVSTSPKSNISPIHDNLTSTLAGQSIESGAGHILTSLHRAESETNGLPGLQEESGLSESNSVLESHTTQQHRPTGIQSMDISAVMVNLEQEIMDYEAATGRETLCLGLPSKSGPTMGGYTAILLNAIVRLTRYLKESHLQLQHEVGIQDKLLESLCEQQLMVDQLSSDILEIQQVFHASIEETRQQSTMQVTNLQRRISRLEALFRNRGSETIGGVGGDPIPPTVAGDNKESDLMTVISSFAGEESHKASKSSVIQFDLEQSIDKGRPGQQTATGTPVVSEHPTES